MLTKFRPVLLTCARAMAGSTSQLKAPALGAFQLIGDPLLTETYAKAGFDVVLVDMQHGIYSERTAFECIQRMEKFPDSTCLVRTANNDPALIQRALDAGAQGVLAPMISNAEEARFLVKNCRYPPEGVRSWGPTRAFALHDTKAANKAVKVIAMIENQEAVDNLDEILDVEGLDGAFVGPCDLSIALGAPPLATPTAPHVVDAITRVREGCKARGKLGMLFCGSKERAEEALKEGWSVAFPQADISWMVEAAQRITDMPLLKKK